MIWTIAASMQADGLDAVSRVCVSADHRGIVRDHHVFRILKTWLHAGEPDPFYNPLNDYVILPTAFEIEKYCKQALQVTTLNEDWEIISPDTDTNNDESSDNLTIVSTLSVTVGKERPFSEAHAIMQVHPQSEGIQSVEVRAVGVTASG